MQLNPYLSDFCKAYTVRNKHHITDKEFDMLHEYSTYLEGVNEPDIKRLMEFGVSESKT